MERSDDAIQIRVGGNPGSALAYLGTTYVLGAVAILAVIAAPTHPGTYLFLIMFLVCLGFVIKTARIGESVFISINRTGMRLRRRGWKQRDDRRWLRERVVAVGGKQAEDLDAASSRVLRLEFSEPDEVVELLHRSSTTELDWLVTVLRRLLDIPEDRDPT